MTRGRSCSAAMLMLILVVAGCLESSNPSPTLCRLMVDLDEEHDLVWIYMQGVEQVRFDNMSLKLNDSRLTLPNVFSLQRNTTATSFTLLAEASLKERSFRFQANLTLLWDEEDEQYQLQVQEPQTDKPQIKSLPFSTLMDKVAVNP